MVKVRTTVIPEDSPVKKIGKTKPTAEEVDADQPEEASDLIERLLSQSESKEDEEKAYYKTLITFPETGQTVNAGYIQSVEKRFRVKESSFNFEAEPTAEYGIVINGGITAGINSPKPDIELWYKNESYRDQRYNELLRKFDEIGIKVITV